MCATNWPTVASDAEAARALADTDLAFLLLARLASAYGHISHSYGADDGMLASCSLTMHDMLLSAAVIHDVARRQLVRLAATRR